MIATNTHLYTLSKKRIQLWLVVFVLLAGYFGLTNPFSISNHVDESASAYALAQESTYRVDRVIDGDTIDVVMAGDIQRVRLLGVNTPETVDPRKTVECFGKEASDFTKAQLEGKRVRLDPDSSQLDKDGYGRLLRYVYLDGTLFNLTLVQKGFAYEYTYKEPYSFQQEFRQAEDQAKLAGEGLWKAGVCGAMK